VEGVRNLLLIALLGSSGSLFSQTICTGTVEQCCAMQKQLCADEKAPSNFQLTEPRRLEGIGVDQSGATFDAGVAVQLRSPTTGAILRSASVAHGNFQLDHVEPGSYRLIVVKITASGPERLKGFDQPKSLVCEETGQICKITIMPIIHGSDNTIDYCPPR
jgi:hypothetical protein